MYRVVVVALLLVPGAAYAEGPWSVVLGAGPAVHRVGTNSDFTVGAYSQLDVAYRLADCPYPDHASTHRPSLNLELQYRFIEQLAAGVHVGARHLSAGVSYRYW